MELKPLLDRIIIRREVGATETASGIIIPTDAVERPGRGEVIAVGPGYAMKDGSIRPLEVKVGDKVYFPSFGGQAITHEGESLLVMREEDLMAIED